MVLSNDLVSQFVKATKDDPPKAKESVVYGTAKVDDDGKLIGVIFDGSDKESSPTPALQTVDVADGNRVRVVIKNHSATITDNVDNPTAMKVSTVTTSLLKANYITADKIESTYVQTKDLEADYITANDIKSIYATIAALEAVDARIDNLDVSQGNIDQLTSNVARINNIIFGSASGDVIQTSFANAVIAQLGDAQIKSAMIKDIVTNDVEIKSEDGKLLISDETIQISDGSRVRVQIGKDASNDYSINVWDQNGNLIFNNAGITDKAIADGLIRNNMISDTANISSSKIYLDEENQTLDVVFKSLSDDISSQGTAISVMQGKISSKIWQQDIDVATGEMTTKYSTLEQTVTGITARLDDVNNDVLNASKTATNYMNLSSNGLVIGDLTASTLGKNALIDTDGFKVRTGTTINSFLGADIIELAKNNESAVISMLNGTFKIYYSSNTSEAGLGIYGKTSTGEERLAFQPVNENDNLTIGWGGYNAGKNGTNIYGHNMKLIAGNDMSIENDHWQINIDGNLFGKASNSSFVELIGLSSDDNTAIGHGGYTAAIGKTNIYGNKIQHIVNTKSGSSSYKPYYEAGDSFETEWYGAGFISSSSKVVYFSIPLAKPIIGNTTPTVKVTDAASSGGLQIRQDSNYVFGSTSSAKVSPSSYSAKVVGDGNFVQIEATMANATNAINNAACGINAKIKITFS